MPFIMFYATLLYTNGGLVARPATPHTAWVVGIYAHCTYCTTIGQRQIRKEDGKDEKLGKPIAMSVLAWRDEIKLPRQRTKLPHSSVRREEDGSGWFIWLRFNEQFHVSERQLLWNHRTRGGSRTWCALYLRSISPQ
ncbi:hypothetical protein F5Y03DRAFT_354202 [Xylaria venustula]|nr:hypothetical protein F5Y03DRAFT_354202 [Xylaria venustula]